MSRVISEIIIASQYLQRKDANLQKAVDHLSSTSLNLSNYRSQFADVKNEAIKRVRQVGCSGEI